MRADRLGGEAPDIDGLYALLENLSPAWQKDASCRDSGLDYFPGRGMNVREQRQVCAGCPVREQCLNYALENRINFGVWGGTSEYERKRMRQRAKQTAA